MTRIACVGIAVQDRLYYVEKLPEGGGNMLPTTTAKLAEAQRQRLR